MSPRQSRARAITTITEDSILTQAVALRSRGLLCHEIAAELGDDVDAATVRRLLGSSAGRLITDDVRDAAAHTLVGGAVQAAQTVKRISGAGDLATRTQVTHRNGETIEEEVVDVAGEGLRLKAAGDLLDRIGVGGKAPVSVTINLQKELAEMTDDALVARATALQARLAEAAAGKDGKK